MEQWCKLEFEFARRLRESSQAHRQALYAEAYGRVSALRMEAFESTLPKDRTAGTSPQLVECLSHLCGVDDKVLEIGCGRGYTCLELAPFVRSIAGTDVAEPVLKEAKSILQENRVRNVTISRVSALKLTDSFKPCSFHTAISIDLVEHLHPEDAEIHYAQVLEVLKDGGQYIMCLPNRLNGPHDCTRSVYPEAKEALGFHLNESTYKELIKALKRAGYCDFKAFLLKASPDGTKPQIMPAWWMETVETVYSAFSGVPQVAWRLQHLLPIRLVAQKGPRK